MIVNFISAWLKDIVVIFIIIFIAELIMPKGNMKRYIDLIIGLLIIIVIISPFARLINYDFNINNMVDNYTKAENLEDNLENDYSMDQEEQIEKLFKEKLKNQIIYLIEESWEYKVADVYIELEKTKMDYEDIKSIKISLYKEKEEKQKNNNEEIVSIEKVPKVEVNREKGEGDSNKNIEEPKEYKKIKKMISKELSIDIADIKIE